MKTAICSFTNQSSRRRFLGTALAVGLAVSMTLLSVPGQAGAVPGVGGKKSLTVYSSNVYIGALIDRILEVPAGDLGTLLEATTLSFHELVQSDPPKRMAAAAAEIAARNPDVVGLVELYDVQIMTAPDQWTPLYSYLDLVVQALAARGAHYTIAVVAPESDVAAPILFEGQITWVRIIDHEAILVRSDLPPGQLNYGNPRTGQFQVHIAVPELGLDLRRGWCAIDMAVRGEKFRLICSHLETEAVPPVQYAQAVELLNGPVNTPLPVVLIGDFNTDPLARDGSFTYPVFLEAGFTDTWNVVNPQHPEGGLTWGHEPALTDPNAQLFDRRIDLVLYRGLQCSPTSFEVIDPIIGATVPCWFSDHAAISATFHLGNRPRSAR